MKISMIIQYTILFSLRSLTIEAAVSSSSTASGSIRGSSSTAVYDSVASAAASNRELELYNSSIDDDRHRFLQVATDDRTLYCGVPNKCASLGGNTVITSKSTLAGVRCCTDNALVGWPYKCRSIPGVYGESNVPSCFRDSNFEEAVEICGAHDGGRLCTGEEILDRCTAGTGCSLNKALVWACTASNTDTCSSSAECCSGLCNASGICEDVNVGGPDTTSPSTSPSTSPTKGPTNVPTSSPSLKPSNSPSTSPSKSPTLRPITDQPTTSPSRSPITSDPTKGPSLSPSKGPSVSPSSNPTAVPTESPSNGPSKTPTLKPVSDSPTSSPSTSPSKNPTLRPVTDQPSSSPNKAPVTNQPTKNPTSSPVTNQPTSSPSESEVITPVPTDSPITALPTAGPTQKPVTGSPSSSPVQTTNVMYVWTDAFDVDAPYCNGIYPSTKTGDNASCFNHSWDTTQARARLWSASTVSGREVTRIFLSDVRERTRYNGLNSEGVCDEELLTTLGEAHALGIEVYGLFSSSDAAFSEQNMVGGLNDFNTNCGIASAYFDGASVNNEYFTSVKQCGVGNENAQLQFLDDLETTRANASPLPLHFRKVRDTCTNISYYLLSPTSYVVKCASSSVSWNWECCSCGAATYQRRELDWNGSIKSALEHMIDIADSVDVQVAWNTGSTMTSRSQAPYDYWEATHMGTTSTTSFSVLAYTNPNSDCRQSFAPHTKGATTASDTCATGDRTEEGMFEAFDTVRITQPNTDGGIHYMGGVYSSGMIGWPKHEGYTVSPSDPPTSSPSTRPSASPSRGPSVSPSSNPTAVPTRSPSKEPTSSPSLSPSRSPSKGPSLAPSKQPTQAPQPLPTSAPVKSPVSDSPSSSPTKAPVSESPTSSPSKQPTQAPQPAPTSSPTQAPLPIVELVGNGPTTAVFPLDICQADCDTNADCQGDMICFQRRGDEHVPGCNNDGIFGLANSILTLPTEDFCIPEPPNMLKFTGDEFTNGYYNECEGDCDSNSDCAGNLSCFQRDGREPVPGCYGLGTSGRDYCYDEAKYTLQYVGNNPEVSSSNPIDVCQSDCDNDDQCVGDLICFQRTGDEFVPGCTNVPGFTTEDFCIPKPTNLLQNIGNEYTNGYYGECQGDCDSNSDCAGNLVCFQRTGYEPVPGCVGAGNNGVDYCTAATPPPTPSPTFSVEPTLSPTKTAAPSSSSPPSPEGGPVTFLPGDLTVPCDNGKLLLSTGMGCRLIATEGLNTFANGYVSSTPMHARADGAAVIPSTDPNNVGGWYYVSNSEVGSFNGGVGAIEFDSTGLVIGYEMLLDGTNKNCGGGLTWWGSWVSCEENGAAGFCHEVKPGPVPPGYKCLNDQDCRAKNVEFGGNYESFASYQQPINDLPFLVIAGDEDLPVEAFPLQECQGDCDADIDCAEGLVCDLRDGTTSVPGCLGPGVSSKDYCVKPTPPGPTPNPYEGIGFVGRFYTTEDKTTGALTRYTPPPEAYTGDTRDILRTPGGTWEYLVLNEPPSTLPWEEQATANYTFGWSKNRADGQATASAWFPQAEGIDIKYGILNMVSKGAKRLITLDLTEETWTYDSTISGLFTDQPDQLTRMFGHASDYIFFAEDGAYNDVHFRNMETGEYGTLVEGGGAGGVGVGSETTGLAFSIDNKFMYAAFQGDAVYEFYREDGRAFNGTTIDTKYHDGA